VGGLAKETESFDKEVTCTRRPLDELLCAQNQSEAEKLVLDPEDTVLIYHNLEYDDTMQLNLDSLGTEHLVVESWAQLRELCVKLMGHA
jgi:hypothetical protein